MNNFLGFIQNKYIYVPFLLWLGIQLFKLIYDLVTTKKFNFKRRGFGLFCSRFDKINREQIQGTP